MNLIQNPRIAKWIYLEFTKDVKGGRKVLLVIIYLSVIEAIEVRE